MAKTVEPEQVFGRLTVLQPNATRRLFYDCSCKCGGSASVIVYSLLDGTTKSCGCLHREQAAKNMRQASMQQTTHNLSRHPLYPVWRAMHARCYKQTSEQFNNYGGRGIKVCDRWHDVQNFIADMGERPRGYLIERINNDGNYEPSNCRWSSPYEQSINRRITVMLTVDGITKPVAEWSKETGIHYKALTERIKLGWDPKDIVTKPSRTRFSQTHCKHGHEFTPDNTMMSQGNRHCRECRRIAGRARSASRRPA